jgi:hypothetical protein
MLLTDHMTFSFSNSISTAAVFLDIEKAFDTLSHPGLFYKLFKLEFSASIIKRVSSFPSSRMFRFSVEGEMSTPRKIEAVLPQGSVLSPVLYSWYKNDISLTPGVL